MPSNGKGDTGGVSGGGAGEISCGNGRILSYHSLGINFSVPVYTTVKGVSKSHLVKLLLLVN